MFQRGPELFDQANGTSAGISGGPREMREDLAILVIWTLAKKTVV